ncbi:CBS domain-containing protein [Aliidiomarina minuta]|uniref:CBS domain-containing protein n=1 Tax=Aliidiomarina minuta TaxID=880057 RepID=A0A432W674_9GAMM|nr:CBS domain-containing protein [Aliidiomarina minuta]RUO25578.1 CBS domain-containing protein [Aliidiomarina minuta]
MQVKEVMTSRPHYLGEDATIREVAEAMRTNSSGFEPLTNSEKVVAVITDRDLVIEGLASGADLDSPAKSVASTKVLYTYEDNPVEDALADMSKQQVQRLLVLDNADNKQLVGIVTIGDIAEKCTDESLFNHFVSAIQFYH